MCQAYRKQYGCDFITAMPTNLYGPNDNFHPLNAHVPAALMQRFHEAKINNRNEVEIWGTGQPRREFLFVDDLAEAIIYLLENYSSEMPINVGTGEDISIHDFAKLMAEITGFNGKIVFNPSYPDGTPLKRLDVTTINKLGWKASTSLDEGLRVTYEWFITNYNSLRRT